MRSRRHPLPTGALLRYFVLAVAAATAAILASPARADSGSQPPAYVPHELLAAARADPQRTFAVIVQGRSHHDSSEVGATVRDDAPAARSGRGIGRQFRSISGVSATLSGAEILKLSTRPKILAITRDEHVALSDASLPVILGEAKLGSELTAQPPSPQDPGATYSYQWQRCAWTGASCSAISDASGPVYTVSLADIGSSLRVAVAAVDGDGATASSAPTDLIAPIFATASWNLQLWPYVVRLPFAWTTLEAASSQLPAIAVVDSGVDGSVPGLGHLVTQASFTGLSPNADVDGRGHGTFVASIAAGAANGHAGAAPGAPVISLDVMDDDGRATTSDVIAAADWIYQNKNAYGIRVANFSLVGTIRTSLRYDPLDKAVEKLWLSGVVVVAAAGNYAVDGAESGVLYAPANDPFVITVGAADIEDTFVRGDDRAAPWSAYGFTPDGLAKPEVGAPGRFMIGAIPPSSTLATSRPDKLVAPGYMELSGTSFAAPVVAGIAANLLALHPEWTPGQVKGALMLGARPLPAATPRSLGVGEVDALASLRLADPPNANQALEQFLVPDPLGGLTPVFDAEAWKAAVDANPNWAAEMWGTEMWGTAAWSAEMWGTTYWSAAMVASEMWGTAVPDADATDAEVWGTGDPALSGDGKRSDLMSGDDWSVALSE
jgi:subtilisin family serine protease